MDFKQMKEELAELIDAGIISKEKAESIVEQSYRDSYTREDPAEKKRSQTTEEILTKQFEHTLEPWKMRHRQATIQKTNATKASLPKLRKTYESLAKEGKLTPLVSAIGAYMLYMEDLEQARLNLMAILLTLPADQATELHNWTIYDMMDESDKGVYGPIIEHLEVPLYPPGELDETNRKIRLDSTSDKRSLQGGATDRKMEDNLRQMTRKQLEGGAYTERVLNEEGTQIAAVSMEATDERFQMIQNALAEIRAAQQTALYRGRGRGGARGGYRGNGRGQSYGYQNQYHRQQYHYGGEAPFSTQHDPDTLNQAQPNTAPKNGESLWNK